MPSVLEDLVFLRHSQPGSTYYKNSDGIAITKINFWINND